MPSPAVEFMRFSAPDPDALASKIADARIKLAAATQAAESLALLDAAADLGSLFTTARMEQEALLLLEAHRPCAETHAQDEAAAWFWNAYATALQYCGRREEAVVFFGKGWALARSGGWRRLEAMVLHHWGRCLAEQQSFNEAESRFADALALRVELNDPLQESSRRALNELDRFRDEGCQPQVSPEI